MKQSRIKRLIPKKLARQLAESKGEIRSALETAAERESAKAISKMQAKGFQLLTRLESGEGVFVREDNVVGLHVQLPGSLYKKLETVCREREATKRDVVIAALEQYLGVKT